MPAAILAVDLQEYLDSVSSQPFVGLPREEIERLHDVIPVLTLDQPAAGHLRLAAYAALHHNYAWLTDLSSPGTLAKHTMLRAVEGTPTFLDDALHKLARHQLEQAGLPDVPCEWRLAGLINHAGELGLVYVVRLHQRWDGKTRGNNELRFSRASYDKPSQLIIDHLHAF